MRIVCDPQSQHQVCPEKNLIARAISELHRDITVYRVKKWLGM